MGNMKDSGIEWIGQIPSNWEICRIKDKYQLITGFTPDTARDDFYDDENGHTWISIADMTKEGKNISESSARISDIYIKSKHPEIVKKGSLLYSFKLSVGKVGFAQKELYTNEAIASFQESNDVCLDYLYYAAFLIEENANINIYGAKILNQDLINNSVTIFPPLVEQRRIARFLDNKVARIDDILLDLRKQVDLLLSYRKTIITNSVTKGIRKSECVTYNQNMIGEYASGYKIKRFKYIADVKSNLVDVEKYKEYIQVSPENIEKDTGRLLECGTVEEAGVISDNHLFYKGQIVYSKIRPNLNKVIIAPFDGLCSADMYPIETQQNIKFLRYLMLSTYFVEQVSAVTRDRVKMPKINQDELGNIVVVIPPLEEQQEIVDYLDDKCAKIDELIKDKEAQIEKMEKYKKSLIYEYVTGKKRVKGAV